MTKVVIVEDDALASMALTQLLESEGYETRSFACTDTAYHQCVHLVPDILIADWCVPGELSTVDLARTLQKLNPSLKVVFVSGYDAAELRSLSAVLKNTECISKPIQFDKFLSDIRSDRSGAAC